MKLNELPKVDAVLSQLTSLDVPAKYTDGAFSARR
jgi:hypothetical protein